VAGARAGAASGERTPPRGFGGARDDDDVAGELDLLRGSLRGTFEARASSQRRGGGGGGSSARAAWPAADGVESGSGEEEWGPAAGETEALFDDSFGRRAAAAGAGSSGSSAASGRGGAAPTPAPAPRPAAGRAGVGAARAKSQYASLIADLASDAASAVGRPAAVPEPEPAPLPPPPPPPAAPVKRRRQMTLVDSGMGAAPAAAARPAAARAASASASAPPPAAPFSAAAAPAAGRPADAAAAGTTGGAPGELQLPGGPQWSGLRRRVWQRSDRPGLPRVDALIIVEGEADARALGDAVSAPAYVLQGTRARSGPHASAELAALPALGLPIVVLTDPDEEGRSLRLLVDEAIGPVGHAFLPEAAALSEAADGRHAAGNRGVEHAAPAALAAALAAAAPSFGPARRAFSREDLHAMGLMNKARGRAAGAGCRSPLGACCALQPLPAAAVSRRLTNPLLQTLTPNPRPPEYRSASAWWSTRG